MATVEATKKRRLTQEDCDTVKYLLKYGRTLKEIAEIIRVDPSTVGKIRLADYDLEKYLAQRKAMNLKTKQNKRAAEAGRQRLNALLDPIADEERDKKILEQLTEEREAEKNGMTVEMYRFCKNMRKEEEERKRAAEVPGQMQMDLQPQAEEPEKKEPDERTKQMRFQAALIDKLTSVLKEMIVTLDNRLTALDEIRDVMTRGRQ